MIIHDFFSIKVVWETRRVQWQILPALRITVWRVRVNRHREWETVGLNGLSARPQRGHPVYALRITRITKMGSSFTKGGLVPP